MFRKPCRQDHEVQFASQSHRNEFRQKYEELAYLAEKNRFRAKLDEQIYGAGTNNALNLANLYDNQLFHTTVQEASGRMNEAINLIHQMVDIDDLIPEFDYHELDQLVAWMADQEKSESARVHQTDVDDSQIPMFLRAIKRKKA